MGATSRSRLYVSGGAINSLDATPGTVGRPRRLFHVECYSANAAARFLHIFDAANLPTNGTIPTIGPYVVPIGGATVNPTIFDYGIDGVLFNTGIVAALSSTQTTLTVITSNDGYFFMIVL